MIADIVDIDGLFLAVLLAGEDAADIGLADGARTERCRVRQQRFQELDRNDFLPFKLTGSVPSMPTFSRHFMWVR